MPEIEDLYKSNPLIKFSGHTEAQSQLVLELGRDILSSMDTLSQEKQSSIDGEVFMRVYGQFWFWVLGAYEVVRTMDEAKACFSERLQNEIHAQKRSLSIIRMPFAKQQFQGEEKIHTSKEVSIYDIAFNPYDMIFSIKGQMYSSRTLIGTVSEFFETIEIDDVLNSLWNLENNIAIK